MYIDMGHLIDLVFGKLVLSHTKNWMEGGSNIVYIPFSRTMNSVDDKFVDENNYTCAVYPISRGSAGTMSDFAVHPSSSTSSASSLSLLRVHNVHSDRAEVLMMKICACKKLADNT